MTDVPMVTDAEGVYLFGNDGKRYFDMNSGTVCVNVGHGHKKILEAMRNYNGPEFVPLSCTTESREKLERLLAEITPERIQKFAFFSEGSVAVEAAIHIAWGYFDCKRPKIISVIPGFHGGTTDMLRRSGDLRRRFIPNIDDSSVIRVKAPVMYGGSPEQQMGQALSELDRALKCDGESVAAFLIEPVLGSAGAYAHPKGYLQEVRKLLDSYGILLIYDEALCGFGRTGKLFALEHDGAVPDILVMAKGLTSGYVPLSAVGLSSALAEYYWEHELPMGSTYFAHPFACHVAVAAVEALLEEQLTENAAMMERVVRGRMNDLVQQHPSVKEGRILGLLGAIELQMDEHGTLFPKGHPAVAALIRDLRGRGIIGSFRASLFLFCPPLSVTERELDKALVLISQSLAATTDQWVKKGAHALA